MSNFIYIIGNGFDLKCNLKSSFSDFVTPAKLDVWFSDVRKCPNFWCLLFCLKFRKRDPNDFGHHLFKQHKNNECLWMDIEGFIKEVCTQKVPKHYSGLTLLGSYIALFDRLYFDRFDGGLYATDMDIAKIKKYFTFINPNISDTSRIDMVEFLKDELMKFERDFCRHLETTIEETESYFTNAKNLFYQIGCHTANSYLIDFNYSHDRDEFSVLLPEARNFIHGSIKKGIIIGFDSSNIGNDFPIALSKARRKMFAQLDAPVLFDFDEKLTIVFFGHSLGEQDYSYFHALFDKYDLYNKNVHLVFLYEKYGKTDEENISISNEYCDKVYNLLNYYASRSGKEDEYKTIISRLHLENRLHIYSLDEYLKSRDTGLDRIAVAKIDQSK